MISLPAGFDYTALVTDLITYVGLPAITVAALFLAFNYIKYIACELSKR